MYEQYSTVGTIPLRNVKVGFYRVSVENNEAERKKKRFLASELRKYS